MGAFLSLCYDRTLTDDFSVASVAARRMSSAFRRQQKTPRPTTATTTATTAGYEAVFTKIPSGHTRGCPGAKCYQIVNWLKAAGSGQLEDVESLYKADPRRLEVRDNHGRTALHFAAKHGRVSVITWLLAKNLDTEVADNDGYTPLHLAAEGDKPEAVSILLRAGADGNAKNKAENAPIHVAIFSKSHNSLRTLLNSDLVDVNLLCTKGGTAMHLAAFTNNAVAAVLLLEHGAKLCKPCEVGMLPVHVATLNGSTETLEAIIKYAEKAGYSRQEVLNLRDASRNLPLHTAVTGGDIRAVRMCLEAGAQIIHVQDDNSTPVHYAASQGNLEMIDAMFEAQPINKMTCIHARDVVGMTPLHKAAIFDRCSVAARLIAEGANVNELDNEGMTPLLLAADKRSWQTTELLLKHGADATVKDVRNRNLLHLIIQNGGRPEQFSFCLCGKKVELANDQDDQGCTPLHYASKHGQLKTIDTLLTMGAVLNAKNNNRESPLHFAASYGRINTCQRLLSNAVGRSAINETNGDGQTALHAAAAAGHVKVLELLACNGASILKDLHGNAAVHLAAKQGHAAAVRSLLNIHSHLLNAPNKRMDTPLHLAAMAGQASVVALLMTLGAEFSFNNNDEHFIDLAIQNEQKDVLVTVVSHDRWKEALTFDSRQELLPILGLIKHMPEVCQMVLDRCKIPSGPDPTARDFHYTYDFAFLDIDAYTATEIRQMKLDYQPLLPMNVMVQFNRVGCLSHTVCIHFLKMKWRAYGMWFWVTNLLIYVIFLASLTGFITNYSHRNINSTHTNSTLPPRHWADRYIGYHKMSGGLKLTVWIILIFCFLNIVKEIVQMIQQRMKYFSDMNNVLEWVLYITALIFIAPFVAGYSSSVQWQCGSIAVFLAWFNLLLFLQRFDFYGIYVVMFLEILRTLVQALVVFSILIVAFGMAFYALMYTDETATFSTPILSLMTVILMMLGNIEYIDSWVNPSTDADPNTLHFDIISYVMLAVFILLMPILLMNLLIGLAVGDIEAVQKGATLKRLAMQVQLHTDLETKIPERLLKYVHKPSWKVYPNGADYICQKFWHHVSGLNYQDEPQSHDCNPDTYIYQELYSQRSRLQKMDMCLDKQNDMLRLILQKMEIKTEADDIDETGNGSCANDGIVESHGMGWRSPTIQRTLLTQSLVLAKWGKSFEP